MSRPKIIFYLIIAILTVLIIFRHHGLELKADSQKYPQENLVLIGKVIKEPDIRDNHIKLTIKAWPAEESQVFLKSKDSFKILVTTDRYPEYNYGDNLRITGKIEEPTVFDSFNYKNYLKKGGILAVSYYPRIENSYLDSSLIDSFMISILDLKSKLRNELHYHISPPQSYILAALTLGDKDRIPQDFKEKLNVAGLRHLTAVSGLHIVVLSSSLMSFFCFFTKKKRAVFLSLFFILLFIVLTGFQISSIRALIMGSFFLIAPLFGRRSLSLRAIVLAIFFMLLINPFLLFYDTGFQLSFLAAFGIIFLSPFFNKKINFIPNSFLGFREILSATFSAYIFTLPILIYNFGQISLAGLISNLLVLPIIPLVMISGLLFIFLSFLLPHFGTILSFFIWFILSYIIMIIKLFFQPFFIQKFKEINFTFILVSYIILFSISFYLYRKNRSVPWFLS